MWQSESLLDKALIFGGETVHHVKYHVNILDFKWNANSMIIALCTSIVFKVNIKDFLQKRNALNHCIQWIIFFHQYL